MDWHWTGGPIRDPWSTNTIYKSISALYSPIMPVLILISLSLIAFSYVYFLNKRLHGPHPLAIPAQPLTEEELDAVSYKDIDILKGIPSQPTQEGYAVIGGSGFLGT